MIDTSLTTMTPKDAVECLNAAKKGPLLRMLAEAMRAATQAQFARQPTPSGRLQSRVPLRILGPLTDKLRKLDTRLAKRPVAMRAAFTSDKPVRLFLWPQSKDREMRAIFEIANASEAGILDRVKACEYCQRFFLARRDVDRFCPGDPCRKNWHRKTPGGKKHNAEYQREYRRQEQDRSARALQTHKAKKGSV
jgi:hypothetical protein